MKWAGTSLTTTFVSATSLTASVPASNLATQGTVQVIATNPVPGGGPSSARLFAVNPQAGGTILPADPSSLAVNATSNVPGQPVNDSDIEKDVVLNRIEVMFAQTATVAQVNSALASVQGGILSMSQGSNFVTVAVPRQNNIRALRQLAQTLRGSAGVIAAFPAELAVPQALPSDVGSFTDTQVLPTRFPAAWNLQNLATKDCESHKVPILVADDFVVPAPFEYNGFSLELPNFNLIPSGESGNDVTHGYDVTTTLGALFNGASPTGANPFSQCLDVIAVQIGKVPIRDSIDRVVNNFPSGRFIMNFSFGFPDLCDVELDQDQVRRCKVDSINNTIASGPERALMGLYWKKRTHTNWNNFLVAVAAGNSLQPNGDDPDYLVAQFYPGAGNAHHASLIAEATDSDPFFSSMGDSSLWAPVAEPDYPDLTATIGDMAAIGTEIVAEGLDKIPGEDNALITGSTTPGITFNDLRVSAFSDHNPDVSAVGESVKTFQHDEGEGPTTLADGTSFSSPQVAGLASYLWLLSNDLRNNQKAQITRQAIVMNTRPSAGGNLIDAYATVLSLDAAALPSPTTAPIRLALLDVNNDSKFDENDLTIFLSHLQDSFGNAVEPTTRDYSRFDLNGDGFTGGGRTEKFDLDRVGSVQYGITNYSADVSQEIEQKTIHFNETAVNDLEILCYYAYSSLYTGDVAERAHLMGGCAGATVKISPGSASVEIAGGRQAFNASVTGTNDPRVTWTATGGTLIFDNGIPIFIAGNAPGVFAIRATSVADPRAFGEAAITVGTCAGKLARFQGSSGLEVEVGVGANENPDKNTNTALTLTDSASNAKASANATATYGSLQGSVHSDDVANDGAAVLMQSTDSFVIVPDDPALVGAQATITQTYHLTSTGSVSGANAQALIVINGEDNVLSTQSPHNAGNVNADRDVIVSASTNLGLGEVSGISNLLIMNAEITCSVNNSDSCDTTGSGTANAQATLAFQSMKVTDLSGNQIGFSVCSVTGFNYH